MRFRAWHIATLVGLVVGAGGMYAVLAKCGLIHSFPRYSFLDEYMNIPVHHVIGDTRTHEISTSFQKHSSGQLVPLKDGRELVYEVEEIKVLLHKDGLSVLTYSAPRFFGEQSPWDSAFGGSKQKLVTEAWTSLPGETRLAARKRLVLWVASVVAARMQDVDLSKVVVWDLDVTDRTWVGSHPEKSPPGKLLQLERAAQPIGSK